MANLKQAFEYASQNPDSDFAKNLEQLASSGSLDGEAKKYGIDLTPFRQAPAEHRCGNRSRFPNSARRLCHAHKRDNTHD